MLTRRADERGAVAIMVGVLASALLVVCALVVDLGLARDTKRQSQNTADAAALAAANVLYPDSGVCTLDPAPAVAPCYQDAIAAAKAYSATNFGVGDAAWSSCTDSSHFYVPTGGTPCVSFTDDTLTTAITSQPTKVRVVVPNRDVTTGFGTLAGVESIRISTTARAALDPGQARSCGLCIIGTDPSGLGNGDVTVNGGSVHSNGSVDTGPNGHLTATPPPNGIATSGTCTGNCAPAAETGVSPIPDPYADVLAFPLSYTLTAKTAPCTQGPGIYPALVLPNSTCTLAPGLYVLTGKWTMNNNTLLVGTGVTLYGTCGTTTSRHVCASNEVGGGLDTKNGDTQLVAPLPPAPYAGFAVIYDPENGAGLNMQGNGNSFATGTIYAPSATLEFPGNSYFTVTNGPIIVGELYGNGNKGGVYLTSVNSATIPSPPDGVRLDQ